MRAINTFRDKASGRALLSIFLLAVPLQAWAIAYCAVREPVRAIQEFYPGYTSYLTLHGTIDEQARLQVEEQLPSRVFRESGNHSLYVVYRDDKLAGFVHARTEKGRYGLDEIIWAIAPNLTINDFEYQRSRGSTMSTLDQARYKDILVGKDSDALLNLFQGTPKVGLPEEQARLFESGIKALLVSEAIWGNDIAGL